MEVWRLGEKFIKNTDTDPICETRRNTLRMLTERILTENTPLFPNSGFMGY